LKDLLFSILKHTYGIVTYKNASHETKQYILQIEKNTKEKIDTQIKNRGHSNLNFLSHSSTLNAHRKQSVQKKNTFNNMNGVLYLKTAFKAWLKYTNISLGKVQENKEKKMHGKISIRV